MSRLSFTTKIILPAFIRKILDLGGPNKEQNNHPYSRGWKRNLELFSERNSYGELWSKWIHAMKDPPQCSMYFATLEKRYEVKNIYHAQAKVEYMIPTAPKNSSNFDVLVQYIKGNSYETEDGKVAAYCPSILAVYDPNNIELIIDDGNQRYYAAKELGVDYLNAILLEKK